MNWEEAYQTGETGWDRGVATPAVALALNTLKDRGKCQILVPGCGRGHDVYALAEAGHTVEGWDLSETAVRNAKRDNNHPNAIYSQVDFFSNHSKPRFFDVIFEHTFLCALPPENWSEIALRYRQLLAPRGVLFAVLFTHMENDEPPPYPTSIPQVIEIFSPYFITGTGSFLSQSYPGREGEETFWVMRPK